MKINNKISEPYISPPRDSRKLEVKTACIEVHHLIYKERSMRGEFVSLTLKWGKKACQSTKQSAILSATAARANRDGQKAAQYVLSL